MKKIFLVLLMLVSAASYSQTDMDEYRTMLEKRLAESRVEFEKQHREEIKQLFLKVDIFLPNHPESRPTGDHRCIHQHIPWVRVEKDSQVYCD